MGVPDTKGGPLLFYVEVRSCAHIHIQQAASAS
jgi:hypothetical protein